MSVFIIFIAVILLILMFFLEEENEPDWRPLKRRLERYGRAHEVDVDIYNTGKKPEIIMTDNHGISIRAEYAGINELYDTLDQMYDQVIKVREIRGI